MGSNILWKNNTPGGSRRRSPRCYIERLLGGKADINALAAKDSGKTALQAAAGGGHLDIVKRLFQEKADVNAPAAAGYWGTTALEAAAAGGHLVVVECLQHAGATH